MARRGQRRSFIGEGAPAVLIYFNEVPLPPLGSLIPTYDVSSIQVLKGPQGTLFGRNATAGGILIYSAPPTYKMEGYLDAHLGNFMDRGLEISEGRRVGNEGVSTCGSRWVMYH